MLAQNKDRRSVELAARLITPQSYMWISFARH